MKLNKKFILTLAFAGVIAFAGVQAHERHSEGERLERLAEHLDLSTEQQATIAEIIANFK